MDFFPNGIEIYAIGGALIGIGIAVIYLGTGIITGASTTLESTLSYFSKLNQFRVYLSSRDWRLVFTLGLIGGAALYAILFQSQLWMTEVEWWRLLVGGVLVGFGTRLGRGCTSGHGVCGVGSLSLASIVNVITFVLIAIGVAQLISALGVTP